MSRQTSNNKLQNILGFFLQGIPAVFVRTDIAFSANPALNEYREYYKNVGKGIKTNADFKLQRGIVKSYELFITPTHEVRHFHDAVLSFSLFELFILKTRQHLCVAQLHKYITKLKEKELPISIDKLHDIVTPSGKFLLNNLNRTQITFDRRFQELFDIYDFNGKSISLSYLLEANAVIAELATLMIDHGTDAANYYYQEIIVRLDPEYHHLLDHFVHRFKKLETAIEVLHCWVSYCLYFFDNPVEQFITLCKEFDQSGYSPVSYETISQTFFAKEDALEKRLSSSYLADEYGIPIELTEIQKSSFYEYFMLPEQMYQLRRHLLDTYVHGFQFNLYSYLEKLNELPIPPVVFFPSEDELVAGTVTAVHESDLRKAKRPFYTIAGHKEDKGGLILIAGITSLPGLHSSIPLGTVDMMLVFHYIYHSLFQSSDKLYNQIIDDMYREILRKNYLR